MRSILASLCFAACTEPAPIVELPVSLVSHTGTTVEIYAAGTSFLAVELGDEDLPRALDGDRASLAEVYRAATLDDPPEPIAALSAQLDALPENPNATPARRYAHADGYEHLDGVTHASATLRADTEVTWSISNGDANDHVVTLKPGQRADCHFESRAFWGTWLHLDVVEAPREGLHLALSDR